MLREFVGDVIRKATIPSIKSIFETKSTFQIRFLKTVLGIVDFNHEIHEYKHSKDENVE